LFTTFTVKEDGRKEKGTFRCKLINLSDDAEEFKLYVTGISGHTRLCLLRRKQLATIDFSNDVIANDIGLVGFMHGILDMDTVVELAQFHSDWLVRVASSLLKANAGLGSVLHALPPHRLVLPRLAGRHGQQGRRKSATVPTTWSARSTRSKTACSAR
jgi:hypothetical protein